MSLYCCSIFLIYFLQPCGFGLHMLLVNQVCNFEHCFCSSVYVILFPPLYNVIQASTINGKKNSFSGPNSLSPTISKVCYKQCMLSSCISF